MDTFTVSEMQQMQRKLQEKYRDQWEPICTEIGQNKLLWMWLPHFSDHLRSRGCICLLSRASASAWGSFSKSATRLVGLFSGSSCPKGTK